MPKLFSTPSQTLNTIAARGDWSEFLSFLFTPDFLPSRQRFSKFPPDDTIRKIPVRDLYVNQREWIHAIQYDYSDDRLSHERHLDTLFWKQHETDAERVICLLGSVGCGKSTLLDYYLRCYCPFIGTRGDDFDKKLILWFDALESRNSADDTFAAHCQSVIRDKCQSIGFSIDSAISARTYGGRLKFNIYNWVTWALEELTSTRGSYNYIVIVVDNLDQCSIKTQVKLIKTVYAWINNPSVNIWRAFLPMWPETHNRLSGTSVSPLLIRSTPFNIGPIPGDAVIESRRELARKRSIATSPEDRVSESAEIDQACRNYILGFLRMIEERPVLMKIIRDLSHGDMRRIMNILGETLQGRAASKVWSSERAGDDRSRLYVILDSLLCGRHAALNPEAGSIGNLFRIGNGETTSRDLLIGVHVLHMISSGARTFSSISEPLLALGYSRDGVENAYEKLLGMNVFHEYPQQGRRGDGLLVNLSMHTDVCNAYWALLSEPAYLDNVAMITNVPEGHFKGMKITTASTEDIVARCLTTTYFLEYVRQAEASFCSESAAPVDVRSGFRERLTALRIPSVWRICAKAYLDRVRLLISSMPDQRVVDELSNLQSHSALSPAALSPQSLVCRA